MLTNRAAAAAVVAVYACGLLAAFGPPAAQAVVSSLIFGL